MKCSDCVSQDFSESYKEKLGLYAGKMTLMPLIKPSSSRTRIISSVFIMLLTLIILCYTLPCVNAAFYQGWGNYNLNENVYQYADTGNRSINRSHVSVNGTTLTQGGWVKGAGNDPTYSNLTTNRVNSSTQYMGMYAHSQVDSNIYTIPTGSRGNLSCSFNMRWKNLAGAGEGCLVNFNNAGVNTITIGVRQGTSTTAYTHFIDGVGYTAGINFNNGTNQWNEFITQINDNNITILANGQVDATDVSVANKVFDKIYLFLTYGASTNWDCAISELYCWNGTINDRPLNPITPPTPIPLQVRNLANNSATNQSINFSWIYNETQANGGAEIFKDLINIANVSYPQNSYNITGLINNTDYLITVKSYNSSGINESITSQNNQSFKTGQFTSLPLYSVNLSYPINNVLSTNNPLNYTFSASFNSSSCYLYTSSTGSFALKDRLISGQNITTCYNQSSYYLGLNASSTIGAYSFENSLNDISNFNHNGAGIGSFSYGSSKGFNQTGTLALNLSGGYVSFGANYSFERTDPFSISLWVNFNSLTGYPALFGKREDTGNIRGYILYYDSSVNKLAFQMNSISGSNAASGRYTTALTTSAWYHIVWTYDGSSNVNGFKLYINSDLDALSPLSNTLSGTIQNSISSQLGANNGGLIMSGSIDNLAVYNYALNQDNVTSIYNNWLMANLTNVTQICNTTQQTLTAGQLYNLTETYPLDYFANFTAFISCNLTPIVTVNSSVINVIYSNDFFARLPNIIYPNASHVNDQRVWINFTVPEQENCVLNNTLWSLNYTFNMTNYSFVETNASDGFYSINISCNDLIGNKNFTIFNFTKDRVMPVIVWYNPSLNNLSTAHNLDIYNFLVEISDSNLFAYEFLIRNSSNAIVYNDTQVNVGFPSKLENISLLLNSSGLWTVQMTASDSHTSLIIGDYKPVSLSKSIDFTIAETNGKQVLKSSSVNIQLDSAQETITEYEKFKDHYTFGFVYEEEQKESWHTFYVRCIDPIIPVKQYSIGHIICWDSKTWVDFENPLVKEYELSPCDDEDDCIKVELYTQSTDKLDFNSIGGLNIVAQTALLTVLPEIPTVSSDLYNNNMLNTTGWFKTLDTNTVSGVLLFIVYIIIIICLIVFAEYLKIPLFMLIVSISIIFFGILIFVIFSWLLGISVMTSGIIYLFRGVWIIRK